MSYEQEANYVIAIAGRYSPHNPISDKIAILETIRYASVCCARNDFPSAMPTAHNYSPKVRYNHARHLP